MSRASSLTSNEKVMLGSEGAHQQFHDSAFDIGTHDSKPETVGSESFHFGLKQSPGLDVLDLNDVDKTISMRTLQRQEYAILPRG